MGQAGAGIASNIRTMLLEEGASEEDARARICACDTPGLLVDDMPGLSEAQKRFAQRRGTVGGWTLEQPSAISLMDIVKNTRATVLIGVTAQAGLFNEALLRQMGANDERPVIFALSNPTSKSECTPEQVVAFTGGRGIMAHGSPFAPVSHEGKTYVSSQCNNMFIVPGMGLGALVGKSTKITSRMFLKASRALSGLVDDASCAQSKLLPDLENIREVSVHVAKAVAMEARDSGLGRLLGDDELEELIRKAQWEPHYYPFRPGEEQ
jgi:malate dehydrogenase (oxaloacetate-decarboxylating)